MADHISEAIGSKQNDLSIRGNGDSKVKKDDPKLI